MFLKKFIVVFSVIFLLISCSQKNTKPDNVYKFRSYISYTTSGIISTADKFEINFTKAIDSLENGKEVLNDIVSIFPKVKGKLIVKNENSLQFVPDKTLKPDTKYSVTIRLNKIFKDVPKEQTKYTFNCKTIAPNLSISTNNLQSYNSDFQYITGVIKSADYITLKAAKKLISAKHQRKSVIIQWNESNVSSKFFEFKLDSLQRFENDTEVLVKWNGKAINSSISDQESITIPGKNNFKVTNVKVVQGIQQHVVINFSDPLKKNQNFKGLVKLEDSKNQQFIVDGNLLKVFYDSQITGNSTIEIFQGIENSSFYKLKIPFTTTLSFEELKPAVRLLTSGTILPNSKALKFNFEAVNLKAVDVRVIKVHTNNILQFLQNNYLNSNDEIKRVGRRIVKKTINLIEEVSQNTKSWKAYSIDLSQLFKADPGAIYRVELSFKKEYSLFKCEGLTTSITDKNDEFSKVLLLEKEEEKEELYWDNKLYSYNYKDYYWRDRNNPCTDSYFNNTYERTVSQNLLASNIGVIAKRGDQKNYFFAVTDILTAQPITNAKISLYNFQQQLIDELKSDSEGIVKYNSEKDIAFAVIAKNINTTYVKLADGNSLSLSKFDVSGAKTQKGIKGFIYGERGVWRPGDSIHLNFVLNDADHKLPKNHPVKLEVRDPNGKLIYKNITKDHTDLFYSFPFKTSTEDITGIYRAQVSVGGAKFYKQLKVETVKPNRLKIKLDFENEVFTSESPIKGNLQLNWLHGAPVRNLKAKITAKVSKTKTVFKGFEKYLFNDPTRNYATEELNLFDGKVDESGIAKINQKLTIGNTAPGMLRVQFLVKAFEKGGGFSIDAFSKKYAPYKSFVGLQSPKEDEYGSYSTATNKQFDVVTLSDQGNPIARKNIEVKIYKIQWRWWWNSGRDNLSTYNSSSYHQPFKTISVSTNSNGKASFDLKIPKEERGRFLIKVIDPVSGHATGRTAYFYDNWWENSPSEDKEAAKMLIFNSDKKNYKVGDVAKITFPSAHVSKALLSLENGTKVLEHQWVNTKKGKTIVEIPITKKMAPNFFVNISLLQPHANIQNDLPIRLYGIIPMKVEDPNTRLEPIINMPNSVEPEKEFDVLISEQNNKSMTYTLVIVEDGLLDLTGFKTPNPHTIFYAKEALGVRTWDVFDDVVGAFSGSVDQVFAIGGDGSNTATKNRKANRFKPVVKHLGPFYLKAGEKKKHQIKLPNYIGSVRTMVIAGNSNSEAYGNAQKTVHVKKPLMVLASLPRKLSPGEKVTLPVTVFSTEKSIKNVTISLEISNGIKILGNKNTQLKFEKVGEKMAYFELDVSKANGFNTVKVTATSGTDKATFDVEIDVVNPNSITTKLIHKKMNKNGEIEIDFETFGVDGTNEVVLQVSSSPPINFEKRLAYLIQYPHGCIEQTTSSVFPQLYLTDLFDLSTKKKNEIQLNIKKGIKRLSYFQRPNGGLSYWIGENNESDWGTSYAGHFMLEAEKKGFVLPFSFKKNWIRYQKQVARNWKPSYPNYGNDLNQAYRLYTLALAGNPNVGAMNRLREYDQISNEAKWRLSAAYGLIGQKEASQQLANTASVAFSYNKNSNNYGSVARNKAMALETMLLVGDNRTFEFATSIAKDLSSETWMSTQTTAYCLLSMGKLQLKNGGNSVQFEYQIQDKNEVAGTDKTSLQKKLAIKNGLNKIVLKSRVANLLYVTIINKGKLPLGKELALSRGFSSRVVYTDINGNSIDISKLKQGQDFKATVTVKNLKNERVKDVALTQIFPSGWEIVNTRFTDFGNNTSSQPRYSDVRDDRVNFYFDINRNGTNGSTKTFSVLLNASYLGTYYLPGIQVEAMYDNDYLVRTKGQWIKVIK